MKLLPHKAAGSIAPVIANLAPDGTATTLSVDLIAVAMRWKIAFSSILASIYGFTAADELLRNRVLKPGDCRS